MDCYVEISSFIEILQTILNVNFLSCENWTCWLKKRWMQIAVFDWKSALSPFHSHNYSIPCPFSDLVLLTQKINHFPGMSEICRKDTLARNMNRMMKLFPKEYNICPKSWCLPAEWVYLGSSLVCNFLVPETT